MSRLLKTVTELAREAGLHIYPEYSAAFQRFHDAAIAQYRESLLAGVGEPDYTDSALYEPTAYTRDKVAAAVAIEREAALSAKDVNSTHALARLLRIMGTFDLATGHADTFDDALDSLESELRDVLGHYRAALTEKQEPVYRLLDWIINECVIYPESDDEKKFAKRLLDAITHPKSGYTRPAPSVNAQERISELEAQNAQLLEALKSALWRMKEYNYQAMEGTIAKVCAAIAAVEGKV